MTEKPFYKTWWFGVAIIAIFLILATICIGYKVINQCEKERNEAAIKTISEILNQESKARPLLPDIVVINVSANNKKIILDSIKKKVSNFLINRYTKKKDDNLQIEIRPYVSFLEKSNNKPITVEQVEELKKHIEFLVKTCESAVEESKQNIDTEISKINTWVSIWIGVFGLLGIFLPIVVNFKSFDSLKDIEAKASEAAKKIEDHKEDIEAIAGIKIDVDKANQDIMSINSTLPALSQQSETARSNSETAIEQSQLNNQMLIAFNAISKLKKLEKIITLNRENPIPIIHTYLSSVLHVLRAIESNHNQHFYKDLLDELKERLLELSYTTIIRDRNRTVALSTFATFINGKNEIKTLTANDHEEIVTNFETMLKTIKQSS